MRLVSRGTIAAIAFALAGPVLAFPASGSPGAASPASVTSVNGHWSRVPPPASRYGHTAVHDAARNRMVVFGGTTSSSGASALSFNDVWALSLSGPPIWSPVEPTDTPPLARSYASAIYDPVRDRVVIFGGYRDGAPLGDVWALSLAGTPAWTPLVPSGTPPVARYQHVAVYDPTGDRMVVFGGAASGGALQNDTWALSLSGSPAWSPLGPTGTPPGARRAASAAYDPVHQQMLLFGGLAPGFSNGVWTLSLAGSPAWSALAPTGTPPSARAFQSASYDPDGDRLVVVGGLGGGYQNDAWALSLSGSPAWAALSPSGDPPPARGYHAAVHDPAHARIVLFAGFNGTSLADLWQLSLTGGAAWSSLPASGAFPVGRTQNTLIRDSARDRAVAFGGYNGSDLNDVWALGLAAGQAWTPIAPAGTPPVGRYGHSAIYDPVRDRMLVFGGLISVPLGRSPELWELTFSGTPTWTLLTPAGTPPTGRSHHSAIYDPVRDRMLVFGGYDGSVPQPQLWALSLAGTPTWALLSPVGPAWPSGRYGHSAIYDPLRDRMIVFGGEGFDETWALSLATTSWTELQPASPPAPMYLQSAIYHAEQDRMVVFAPTGGTGSYSNETWSLPLASPSAWAQLAPEGGPPPGRLGAAIYDPARDRAVTFGVYTYDGSTFRYSPETWALQWNENLDVPPGRAPALRLAPARPNPSSGEDIVLGFTLPVEGHVSLSVYDVSGREVRSLANGRLPAGEHAVRWDRRTASGALAPAGLYFYELRVGTSRLARKVVLAR